MDPWNSRALVLFVPGGATRWYEQAALEAISACTCLALSHAGVAVTAVRARAFPPQSLDDLNWDEILLIQRGKDPGAGLWCPPGGSLEAGESIAQAALRELQEETGLQGCLVPDAKGMGNGVYCVSEALVHADGSYALPGRPVPDSQLAFHFVLQHVLAAVPAGSTPHASDDAADVAWVPLSSLTSAVPVPEAGVSDPALLHHRVHLPGRADPVQTVRGLPVVLENLPRTGKGGRR